MMYSNRTCGIMLVITALAAGNIFGCHSAMEAAGPMAIWVAACCVAVHLDTNQFLDSWGLVSSVVLGAALMFVLAYALPTVFAVYSLYVLALLAGTSIINIYVNATSPAR